ncbi:hypothetical protein [Aquimarina pacifica]|uniref:hypothetical protein n=1 Tax=Aquimarina pacifica TaxID=1296415 RepID=UPI000472F382|nr:hypothetical protein [Aquimarina pacifica]
MRSYNAIIFSILKQVTFIVIMFTIIIGPCAQTLSFFSENNLKLVQIDLEEDLDVEEEKESDAKEPKVQISNYYKYDKKYAHELSVYALKLSSYKDFYEEILIPPPDSAPLVI